MSHIRTPRVGPETVRVRGHLPRKKGDGKGAEFTCAVVERSWCWVIVQGGTETQAG